ncbi:MAG: ferrous iron transporter B [Clostridia bacterium]|nr:ferrous iron transporter B [Clostridia bacterium]
MKNVILVGNPNVGKTTLFNTLTKRNEKASNWHGVTVDIKNSKCKIKSDEFLILDLPGVYSLNPYSQEEKIACDFLCKNKDKLIVNICDANTLKRNLKLTKELIDNSYNVILAVNMISEVKDVNLEEIKNIFNVPVIGIDARKNESVDVLKTAIYDYFHQNNAKKQQIIRKINNKIDNYDKIIYNLNQNIDNKLINKIDKILLNKFVFLPVFLGLIFLIFYLTFGDFGNLFSKILNEFFMKIYLRFSYFINSLNTPKIIKDFLIKGVLNSFISLLSFLPQILLLTTLINILEDTGFMSRVAFMFDGILRKIGLTGKSLFSIMMGYGCTTTAILTTRNLEKMPVRRRTAFVLPFTICQAKLPIFLTIASLFFNKNKYLFVFLLYLISIIFMIIFSSIYKKFIPDKEDLSIMELPKYRLPYLKKIIKDGMNICFEFLYKVGTIIIFVSAIFWLLQNFTLKLEYLNGNNYSKSILYQISSKIEVIFKPIGLGQAGIISALFLGIVAKELVIVGLSLINGVIGINDLVNSLVLNSSNCYFTFNSSIVFLIFILVYSPCISSISMIKNELGFKSAIYIFIFHFMLSYLICFIIYRLLLNINILYFLIIVFILAIFVKFMLKLNRNKLCKGNCNACRKI